MNTAIIRKSVVRLAVATALAASIGGAALGHGLTSVRVLPAYFSECANGHVVGTATPVTHEHTEGLSNGIDILVNARCGAFVSQDGERWFMVEGNAEDNTAATDSSVPVATPEQVSVAPQAIQQSVPVSYANCSAVRAAGAAPIRTGEAGYGRHLDRDGDGIGCE